MLLNWKTCKKQAPMRQINSLLFVFLALASALIANAQDKPFYLDDAKWTIERIYPILGSEDGHGYWEIYTLDDTTVMDKAYRKVAIRNLCELWPDVNGDLQPNPNLHTDEFLLGGLREEAGKVFFLRFDRPLPWKFLQSQLKNFVVETDYLLYDFNALPGDTVRFSDLNSFTVSNGDTTFFTKENYTIIEEELSAIDNHRRWRTRSSGTFNPMETGTWIEGIGSSYGLLGSYDSFLTYLRCFSLGGEVLFYGDNCEPCAGIVSANSPSPSKALNIYPNPARHRLLVASSPRDKLRRINIYDSLGRLTEAWRGDQAQVELDIAGYPAGIFVVEIQLERGAKQMERLIVRQ